MAEFDKALISCVKDYPCLYSSKSAEFNISWKKENAWAEVSKKVGCSGFFSNHKIKHTLFSVDNASKRWKVLRECYTKEHKKVIKPTGTGADEVKKVCEFFHLMDFLQDFVKHRRLEIHSVNKLLV